MIGGVESDPEKAILAACASAESLEVSSATVTSAPNAALGKCVASAVKKAKFRKTQKGGSVIYPFIF